MKKITMMRIGLAIGMLVVLAPSLALALTYPTPPPGGGPGLTGSQVVADINYVVTLVLGVSLTIAIGFFIYGAVRFAMGGADATKMMTNAAIGIACILGIGLIVSTIGRILGNGLNIG